MNTMITPFCISVFVICKMGAEAKYLLIKRCGAYLTGTWQMVTGGIEAGEKAWEAALREIHEETGLNPTDLYSADTVETFYLASKDKIAFVPVFVAFVDSCEGVRLAPNEHDAYAWLSLEEATYRLVWTEQRRCIAHVHVQFVSKEPEPLLKLH